MADPEASPAAVDLPLDLPLERPISPDPLDPTSAGEVALAEPAVEDFPGQAGQAGRVGQADRGADTVE